MPATTINVLFFQFLLLISLWKSVQTTTTLNVAKCRSQGFDPMRLACSTCDLLPAEDLMIACKECCQSYMDLSRLRSKPYVAAVLVQAGRSGGVIEELVADTEAWENLVNEKGGRLQVLKRGGGGQFDMMEMLMRGGSGLASEVLLLDEKLPKAGEDLDYEDVAGKAEEVISLQGLSKDDIQDLIKTLL